MPEILRGLSVRRPSRRRSAALVALVALVGAVLTAAPASAATDRTTPATSPATAPAATSATAHPAPSTVRVVRAGSGWRLQVDGAPWQVRGVTFGDDQRTAPARMADLHALGANTIRIWGVDDVATPKLLAAASRRGIKVIVGHWLDQGVDYATDTAYEQRTRTEVLRRVRALKGDPGVLMWDLGNEVMITAGGSPAQVQRDRIAYARFVDSLAVAIHRIDPRHPVTSTDAWTGAWPIYQRYAPHLDLDAVNSYQGVGQVYGAWQQGRRSRPYIVTESGPSGDWEVAADRNGIPAEPSDVAKAHAYTAAWRAIAAHPKADLGGTLFDYGTHRDDGGAWYDLRSGGRRLGWEALHRAFTGHAMADAPPVIRSMTVPQQAVAGSTVMVSAVVTDRDHDPVRCSVQQSSHAIDGSDALVAAAAHGLGGCRFQVTVPSRPGVWKLYVTARDGHGNAGVETRSIRATPRPA